MTPYMLGIVLHYYYSRDDYVGRGEPILPQTLEWLVKEGLLERTSDNRPAILKMTERGHAYVEALLRVPLPRQIWSVEWPNEPFQLWANQNIAAMKSTTTSPPIPTSGDQRSHTHDTPA